MKVNFNQNLLNLNGVTICEGGKQNLTLLLVTQNALLNLSKEEANLESGKKVDRYNLTLKITVSKEQEVDLSAEEVVLIKSVVGKMYVPLIVGQVFRMLEGQPTGIIENLDPEVIEDPVSGRIN